MCGQKIAPAPSLTSILHSFIYPLLGKQYSTCWRFVCICQRLHTAGVGNSSEPWNCNGRQESTGKRWGKRRPHSGWRRQRKVRSDCQQLLMEVELVGSDNYWSHNCSDNYWFHKGSDDYFHIGLASCVRIELAVDSDRYFGWNSYFRIELVVDSYLLVVWMDLEGCLEVVGRIGALLGLLWSGWVDCHS